VTFITTLLSMVTIPLLVTLGRMMGL